MPLYNPSRPCYHAGMNPQQDNARIDHQKATDRMFSFLVLLALGKSERVSMERAIERFADGSEATIHDHQRDKRRQREWLVELREHGQICVGRDGRGALQIALNPKATRPC